MTPLSTTLPESSNDGYVAAAYIVFFALLLIYVAIMAIRLSRVERRVRELREDRHEDTASEGDRAESGTRQDDDIARPPVRAGEPE